MCFTANFMFYIYQAFSFMFITIKSKHIIAYIKCN